MRKKGQAISGLTLIVAGIGTLVIILAISLMVLGEIKDSIRDETYGYANTTYTIDRAYSQLNESGYMALSFPADTTLYSIINISPNASVTAQVNDTGLQTVASGIFYLTYRGDNGTEINLSHIRVLNVSGTEISSGNYSIQNISTDVWYINMTTAEYQDDNLSILYNYTFGTTFVFGDSSTGCYFNCSPEINNSYGNYAGVTYGIKLQRLYTDGTEYSGINFEVNYINTTRTLGDGETEASTAAGEMITNLSNVPIWIGVLIIILFASAVLYIWKRNQ